MNLTWPPDSWRPMYTARGVFQGVAPTGPEIRSCWPAHSSLHGLSCDTAEVFRAAKWCLKGDMQQTTPRIRFIGRRLYGALSKFRLILDAHNWASKCIVQVCWNVAVSIIALLQVLPWICLVNKREWAKISSFQGSPECIQTPTQLTSLLVMVGLTKGASPDGRPAGKSGDPVSLSLRLICIQKLALGAW